MKCLLFLVFAGVGQTWGYRQDLQIIPNAPRPGFVIVNGTGEIFRSGGLVSKAQATLKQEPIRKEFYDPDTALRFFDDVILRTDGLSRSLGMIWDIAGGIFDFADYLGGIMGLFGGDPQMEYMKQQFAIINAKLDQILQEIQEIFAAIEMQTIQVQYVHSETVVRASMNYFRRILQATSFEERQQFIQDFIINFENDRVETELMKLADGGLSGDYITGQVIGSAVYGYTRYHRRKVEGYLNRNMQIVMAGMTLTSFWYKLTGRSMTVVKQEWTDRAFKAEQSCLSYVQLCKDTWREHASEDLYQKANEYGGDYAQRSEQTWYFMIDKYDWKYWASIYYNDVSGWDRHTIDGDHIWHFRVNGVNVALMSFDISLGWLGNLDDGLIDANCWDANACNDWSNSNDVWNHLSERYWESAHFVVRRTDLYCTYSLDMEPYFYFGNWDYQTVMATRREY